MSDKLQTPPKINRKKVIRQGIILVAIILVILGIRFVPWLFSQSITTDKYAGYKDLYNTITNYNYDKGRDKSLETRLDDGTSSVIAENNPTRYFFNLQAKALYYQHFGYTRKAIHLLEEAANYSPDEEELDVVEYAIELYSSLIDDSTDPGV